MWVFQIAPFLTQYFVCRNRSAIIGDWDSAFAALHQQFGIPLPDDTSVMTSLAELPPLSGYRASIFPAEVMSPAVMTPVTPLEPIDYLMSKRLNTVAAIDTASISSLERSFANSAPPLSAGPVGPSLSFTDGGHVPLAVSRMGSVPVGHPTRRQSTFADLPRLKVRLPGSGAAVGLQASQLRTYREAISELKDLQDVMRLSGCLQWLLLISAVLVDAETIVDTFCDLRKTDAAVEKELLFKWTTTLENTDAHGYQDLVMVVRAELSRRA